MEWGLGSPGDFQHEPTTFSMVLLNIHAFIASANDIQTTKKVFNTALFLIRLDSRVVSVEAVLIG